MGYKRLQQRHHEPMAERRTLVLKFVNNSLSELDEKQIIKLFRNLQLKVFNMSKAVKTKIYQLLERIEDETILNQVMENVAFYATKKDVVDQLTPAQLRELDKAIKEADYKEIIPWDDFKKEMSEWKKK